MGTSMKKRELLKEIASASGVKQAQVDRVLGELVAIACREAKRGFRIPGLCSLRVVRREQRRVRNPATGETLLIGPRKVLKITPLKAARDAAAPRAPDLVRKVEEPAPPPPPSVAARQTAPRSAPPAAKPAFISFTCGSCGQEIEASSDLAGTDSECPACGMPLTVPLESQLPAVPGPGGELPQVDLRNKTIRIEL